MDLVPIYTKSEPIFQHQFYGLGFTRSDKRGSLGRSGFFFLVLVVMLENNLSMPFIIAVKGEHGFAT